MLEPIATKDARAKYMLEQNNIFMGLMRSRNQFVVFASVNLILILSLTWKNISESKQIRLMVTSMSKSIIDLFAFIVLMCVVLVGFAVYITNCFGFGFGETKDISYSSMTLFKMFIGKNIGSFYRTTSDLAPLSSYLFIFAFAALVAISNSIILVIVSLHYEKEVLGQEITSDIKLMQAVCFCNISLQKRETNKHAEEARSREEQQQAFELQMRRIDDKNINAGRSPNLLMSLQSKLHQKLGSDIFQKMTINLQAND